MINQYILVALIYIAVSLTLTIFISILNPPALRGKLVLVFMITLIASFSGGLIYTVFQGFFDYLSSIEDINLYPAITGAVFGIWLLHKVFTQRDD